MSSLMRWASACTSRSRPVASTAGSAATAPLSAAPARSGSVGTRSLAAATRLSDAGRRRYHAGRGPGGRMGGSASTCDASLPRAQRRGQICARRRRAGLSAQVRLVPADPAALPFRAAHFTHVWILEALPRLPDPTAALREAHRVLRRGGTVAIQDLVCPDAVRAAAIPGWTPATAAERMAALERFGFVEVALRDRTAEAPERSAQVVAARDRLLARLRRDPRCAQLVREREALAAALADGTLRVVQLVARRP